MDLIRAGLIWSVKTRGVDEGEVSQTHGVDKGEVSENACSG